MSLDNESINNELINSIRKVNYINGKKCVNCYYTDECPCNLCIYLSHNITIMDWNEFITNISHTFLKDKLTKVPNNYDEYCELYEDYHDLPPLIYSESDHHDLQPLIYSHSYNTTVSELDK